MKKNRCVLRKWRIKMRYVLFVFQVALFLLFPGHVKVMAALPQTTINLSLKDALLEDVIWEIEKQTDYSFAYNANDLVKAGKVTVVIKGLTVQAALDMCLKGSGLTYLIQQNIIVIKQVGAVTPDVKKVTIRGKVVDKDSLPLPGVTIVLKGTTLGVVTDKDGKYMMAIPVVGTPVLVFTFVGMKREEVKYAGKPVINVMLHEDVKMMDEVVVSTGYQSIRKKEMTGSTQTVNREDLFFDGTNSIEQMLQGKLAGTLVMNNSGLVGARQKVRVRGTSTLLGNQEPVWVVDGIIQEDPIPFKTQELNAMGNITPDNMDMVRNFIGNAISWLNPNDIDDITVLKDASATSLYGVKAANGVILITTKKGQIGRLSVGYSGNVAFSPRNTYHKMNLMNSKERIDVSREVYDRRLVTTNDLEEVGFEGALKRFLNKEISYDDFNREVKYLETVNTDWFDILYRDALSQNHSISISGGTDKTRYYWSANVNQNNGTAKGNQSTSYGTSMNFDMWLRENITLGVRLSGSMSETDAYYGVNPYSYATQTSRAIPCFDENGERLFYAKSRHGFLFNILNELDESGNRNQSKAFNMNVDFKFDILNGLRFQTTFGLAYTSTLGESWASELTYAMTDNRGYEFGQYSPADQEYKSSQLPHGGELNTAESRNVNYTWKNLLSYNQLFGERHRVSFLIGQECRSNKYDGVSSVVYGYFPGRGKTVSLPPVTTMASNGEIKNNGIYDKMSTSIVDRKANYLSFLASASYSYAERYVLSFNIRSDASNRFGQDTRNRFLPVWSVGLRWNVAEEAWMEQVGLFNELSFRGSYGWQGNVAENFGPDLIASIPSNNISQLTGEYVLKIKSLPYGNLRWEKTKNINLGADFGFLKNRLMATFEFYYKKTEDVILNKEVAFAYGVASMPINGGDISNKGWDLSVSCTPVRTDHFTWSLSLNTGKVYNKVNSEVEQNKNWTYAVNGDIVKKGYPVSSIWAFEFLGLKHETGLPDFYCPKLEDCPGGDRDATAFMKYVGKLDPDFSGGLSTSVRYRSFSVSASFNLSMGGKRFLAPVFDDDIVLDTPSAYVNLPKEMVNRWRKPGDEEFTNMPTLPYAMKESLQLPTGDYMYYHRAYNYMDIRVADASFLRCNSISVSYVLPEKVVKFLHLKNVSLSGNISNPFIIMSNEYKGVDPEVATGSQPISKTYSVGLSISL